MALNTSWLQLLAAFEAESWLAKRRRGSGAGLAAHEERKRMPLLKKL